MEGAHFFSTVSELGWFLIFLPLTLFGLSVTGYEPLALVTF